jgi:hypothetical protein
MHAEISDIPAWSLPRRILFRFICAYFVLYILPFPLMEAGQFEMEIRRRTGTVQPMQPAVLVKAALTYTDAWHEVVKWTGKNVLRLSQPITIRPSGSGDTTWNYVQVLCFAILAAGITLVWSLVDWRKTNYAWARETLRIYVRFYLAVQMIVYGAMKVIPAQFPAPALDRLVQPFGDASPMGLLWTFMGASPAYVSFTGASELLGGLLLTTRRTTLLGALVSAGVMAHIVALNFCYDVPVKLFSTHLLIMAIWLIGPDVRSLFELFVLRKPAAPGTNTQMTRWVWLNWSWVGLRTLLVGGFVYLQISSAIEGRRMFVEQKAKRPLFGVWAVEQFSLDGENRPPLTTDPDRWRRFIVDYPGSAGVQLTNASRVRYRMQINPAAKTVTLQRPDFSDWKAELTFTQPDADHLFLEGELDGHAMKVELRRENLDEYLAQFRLLNRGFHWINEYPYNR